MCGEGVLNGPAVSDVHRAASALRVPEGLRLRPHQVLRGQVQLHIHTDAVQGQTASTLLTASPARRRTPPTL